MGLPLFTLGRTGSWVGASASLPLTREPQGWSCDPQPSLQPDTIVVPQFAGVLSCTTSMNFLNPSSLTFFWYRLYFLIQPFLRVTKRQRLAGPSYWKALHPGSYCFSNCIHQFCPLNLFLKRLSDMEKVLVFSFTTSQLF